MQWTLPTACPVMGFSQDPEEERHQWSQVHLQRLISAPLHLEIMEDQNLAGRVEVYFNYAWIGALT